MNPVFVAKLSPQSGFDNNGRYQITALSVGSYSVTITLTGFSTFKRENVQVTSDFTATVNAEMTVGGIKDEVNVKAETPIVNVTTATVQQVLQGSEIADLPTQRDIPSLLTLVPGFQTSSLRGACNGGVGVFCNPTVPLFNTHTASSDSDGQNQGRIMVDGMSINMGRNGVGINENVGQANGLVLNTAAAQEVSFTLSGSLGESETGGAAINIVPRTGGNRFSGGYALTYANTSMFDRNTSTRLTWSPATGNTTPVALGPARGVDRLASGLDTPDTTAAAGNNSSRYALTNSSVISVVAMTMSKVCLAYFRRKKSRTARW